jgi:RND family efflux transporter MFP subunit
MKASRDKAKLNLDYTHVLWEKENRKDEKNGTPAPAVGRISRRFVDPGNLVLADNTLLTTIVTEDPIYAYFDVDERTYEDKFSGPGLLQSPVLIRLANEEEEFSQAGTVNFVDNRVNANTGTIRMRGIFTNPTGRLKCGLFVRIRLPLGHPKKAFIIPDEAIQSDQGKKYVYVVRTRMVTEKDGTQEQKDVVEYRSVQIGQPLHTVVKQEDGTEKKVGLRVITEGLKEGERVVVTGMQRVHQGSAVKATPKDPPGKPESPLGKLLAEAKSEIRNPKSETIPK